MIVTKHNIREIHDITEISQIVPAIVNPQDGSAYWRTSES